MSQKQRKENIGKVSRRDFLKKIGVFAVGGVALTKLDKLVAGIMKATGEGGIEPQTTVCYTDRVCSSYKCIAPASPFQCNMHFYCNDFYCPNDGRFICVNDVGCARNTFVCSFDCRAQYHEN